MVDPNPSEPFRAQPTKLPASGDVSLIFGVLTNTPPEEMKVTYTIVSPSTITFAGNGSSVEVCDGSSVHTSVVVCANSRVTVPTGARRVVFNTNLVGSTQLPIVVRVTCTQNGVVRINQTTDIKPPLAPPKKVSLRGPAPKARGPATTRKKKKAKKTATRTRSRKKTKVKVGKTRAGATRRTVAKKQKTAAKRRARKK